MSNPDSANVDQHYLTLTFGAFLMYTSLSSLHLYLCAQGFVTYRKAPSRLRATRRNYVRFMFLLLFLFMATFIVDTAIFFVELRELRRPVSLTLVLHAFLGISHLTADGFLVWRCYVVWARKWWYGRAPVIPYVISMGIGLFNAASSAICSAPKPTSAICRKDGISLYRGLYFLTATSVNVTATSLICLRLMRMKRRLDRAGLASGRAAQPVPYTKLTAVLVESALPFTVLGILTAILAFVNTNTANDTKIFTSRLWTVTSGLTAQAILYRVVCGLSWTSTPDSGRNSTSIHFSVVDGNHVRHDLTRTENDIPKPVWELEHVPHRTHVPEFKASDLPSPTGPNGSAGSFV